MPCEPVRFLHATGLRLDRPLRDAGELPDDVRRIVEDATLIALENLVAACAERDVDFLLLAGDTFHEEDRSLRARVALRSALDRLSDSGIPVFVSPGASDPADAWEDLGDLPESVTILPPGGECVDVVREDRTVAVIAQVTARYAVAGTLSESNEAARPCAVGVLTTGDADKLLRLSVAPHGGLDLRTASCRELDIEAPRGPRTRGCDYLAAGCGVRRTVTTAAGVLHWPGTAQGLGPRETGARGATLVEIDAEGQVARTFVPLAAVRREQFLVHVNEKTIREELLDEMRFVLERCAPEPCERAWLVTWAIHGHGPLFDTLADNDQRRQLVEALDWEAARLCGLMVRHQLRLYRDAAPEEDEHPLHAAFAAQIESDLPSLPDVLRQYLRDAAAHDPALTARLVELWPDADAAAVAGTARGYGRTWLAAPVE